MNLPETPKNLSPEARSFWRKIVKRFELEDHHLKILKAACQCLDRINEARREVQKAGSYFTDRWGQPKAHPALAIERDQKTLFARLIRELCLDLEPDDSRPPRSY